MAPAIGTETDAAGSRDFKAVFEVSPAPCLILTPQLTIAVAGEAYMLASMTYREAIIGH